MKSSAVIRGNVGIVGAEDSDIRRMFLSLGFTVTPFNMNAKFMWSDYDLVCFTGGSDVNPLYYGEKPHPSTHFLPLRDAYEKDAYLTIPAQLPKVGICRGGQFLNVMSGGKLWQDVDGHCRTHELTDSRTNEKILVTSTHHQMMRPTGSAKIIATANESTYKESALGYDEVGTPDYEILWYEELRTLCFQPHPEYELQSCLDYFNRILEETTRL
jgi:hypothetical protein